MNDKILTAKEVSRLLGMHEGTVRALAQRGKIPAARIGGSWRFSQKRLTLLFAAGELAGTVNEKRGASRK